MDQQEETPQIFIDVLLHFAIVLKRGTAQKMKFSIKDFFSKCDQMQGGKI